MFAKKHVFIIEDDARHLLTISAILDELEMPYIRNTSGAQALEQAQTLQPRPDIILLDMDLPRGDPFAIYDGLQNDPDLYAVPVIAMTEQGMVAQMTAAIEARNFAGVMTKPVSEGRFKQLLRGVLKA